MELDKTFTFSQLSCTHEKCLTNEKLTNSVSKCLFFIFQTFFVFVIA